MKPRVKLLLLLQMGASIFVLISAINSNFNQSAVGALVFAAVSLAIAKYYDGPTLQEVLKH